MQWLKIQSSRWITLLLEVRRSNLSTVYSFPIIAVIAITCVRLLSGAELVAELPFTTYFPAIVMAALLGGHGPGLAATLLVSIIAWYPTIPDEFSSEAGLWVFSLALVTAVNIVVVALVTAAVTHSIDHKNERETAD